LRKNVGQSTWDSLPKSIPQVYFDYLAAVNPDSPKAPNFISNSVMFQAVRLLSVLELANGYRPMMFEETKARATLRAASLEKVRADNHESDVIERLISNQVLRWNESLGSQWLKFELDPVAEYVAAAEHAHRCGSDLQLWLDLKTSVEAAGENAKGFYEALRVTHGTHWEERGWPGAVFEAGVDAGPS